MQIDIDEKRERIKALLSPRADDVATRVAWMVYVEGSLRCPREQNSWWWCYPGNLVGTTLEFEPLLYITSLLKVTRLTEEQKEQYSEFR